MHILRVNRNINRTEEEMEIYKQYMKRSRREWRRS